MPRALRLDAFPVVIPALTHYASVTRAGHACQTAPTVYDSFDDLRPSGMLHHAQDIMAAEGALVVAARAGVVTSVGFGDKGGNFAYVRDDDGFTHYYAHMLKPARVSKNQRVKAGHVLGYVGRTGNATTACPHLHYGTKNPANVAVNSYAELRRLWNAGAWRGGIFASPQRRNVLIGALALATALAMFRVSSRGIMPRPWLARLV